MAPSTERHDDEVGAFFATHADRLQRKVGHRIRGVADELIEDACQIASTTLLRRVDITLDARRFAWLITVAVR